MVRRLVVLLCLALLGFPARAAEVYQVSTILNLLAGGYDGDVTMSELLRHGGFGLGTFNGVNGEMMVLDGRIFRGTTDGRAHPVPPTEQTPFAEVVAFHPQGAMRVASGRSLEQLQADLDALPSSASRVLVARIDGRFKTIQVRSEPRQKPPYRSLADVIREQQAVNTFNDVNGTLIGFRYPPAASSTNVVGWHFHFLSANRTRGGHVLSLTTGPGRAAVEEVAEMRVRLPAAAPATTSVGSNAVRAVEHPQQ
jgi:acetolactate decarboxylase